MSMTKVGDAFGIVVVSLAVASGASAQSYRTARHYHGGSWRPVAPGADATELSELAPAGHRSAAIVTLGDAAFARDQAQRSEDYSLIRSAPPHPCDAGIAETRGYFCIEVSGRLDYCQAYALMPAYISAPQTTLGCNPSGESSTLPPTTGLAWVINGLRFEPH